jgi:nitrogen fixation NifU-like protein
LSTRIPLPYSLKVLELFKNPKNLGLIEDTSMVESSSSQACGDLIKLYLKIKNVNGEDVIEKATFESYGCDANIAAASILTEIISGESLREAWNISWKALSDILVGLPPIKYHGSILAVGALKRAIRASYKKLGVNPDWLPRELTVDEKQVLEEEEIIERCYRSLRAITTGKRGVHHAC